MPLGQQNSRECRARTRPLIHRQRGNPVGSRAEQEFDAHNRSAAGDAGIRDDRVPGLAEDLDRRYEGDVEMAQAEIIGQPAGQIVDHVQTAARQPVDQRLRIEILHCPDPQVAT